MMFFVIFIAVIGMVLWMSLRMKHMLERENGAVLDRFESMLKNTDWVHPKEDRMMTTNEINFCMLSTLQELRKRKI
jgi:hypothetical protein